MKENSSFIPYVYRVTNKITKQFYIGMKAVPGEIGIDYFTSSSDPEFRKDFQERPGNYLCEKLFKSENLQEVLDFEADKILENKGNELCLNKTYFKNNHLYPTGHAHNYKKHMTTQQLQEHSARMKIEMNKPETKQKCSESHKGLSYNKGKHHPGETKQKIRNSLLGRISSKRGTTVSLEVRQKIRESVKKTFTEERRKFQSDLHKGKPSWNKGIQMTAERKQKLSELYKGTKWYTNGVQNKLCKDCPEGWWLGRTPRKKKASQNYTNEHER